MTKRTFIFGLLIFICGYAVNAQTYSYGIKGGIAFSSYQLSNGYVFYNTEGSGLSFNAGVFGRRHISKYYIQGEANFSTGMKAKITFRRNEYEIRKSSINIPVMAGRIFYPGNLRLYAGISPGIYLGTDEFSNFLIENRLAAEDKVGSSPALAYIAGTGIDLAKFTIDIRYEGNLLGGFYYEDKNPDIRTYHRFSHIQINLGYKFQ